MTISSSSSIIAPESDFTFVTYDGGTKIRITGYTGAGGSVHIPDMISGLPVVQLSAYSFNGTSVVNVYVPEGVTTINDGSFEDCTQLEGVSLPSTLDTMGAEVFKGSSSLKNVVIPDAVTSFGVGDMVEDGHIFDGCSSLEEVTIGSGITNLHSLMFSGCSSLDRITFTGDPPGYVDDEFSGTFVDVNPSVVIGYYSDNSSGWTSEYAGFPTICLDCSELSSSSQSSISSSSVSSQSSQSSLYGYLAVPSNLRKTSFNPTTREFLIQWDWTNPPLANPQEPTGFTIERRIGSRDWSVLSFSIPGDVRSYIDTLTSDELRNVLINGEQVGYRIKAYWEDPS